jgi:hypothetical protein
MDRHFPDSYAFLEAARAQGVQGDAFVIGGLGERRVTLYAQQCRAVNLVAALATYFGVDLARKRVAVIGGGAAGMTAAAALRGLGVDEIHVFDVAAAPMHPQRGSHTRFLHPNLFHWPEPGWRNDHAHLPIGDWSAGYADSVREQVLQSCGDVTINYCVEVRDITDSPGGQIALALEPLSGGPARTELADLALVSTGFPVEQPPDGALGGSYWHQLEGLDLLEGAVHVVGDGDSALTEVFMLFVDRLGHECVKEMAEGLVASARLRRDDLIAQGDPHANADPLPEDRSEQLMEQLRYLVVDDRHVVIHARDALKGGSFLLNRLLVSHVAGLDPSLVQVVPRDVPEAEVARLPGSVIWRAGLKNKSGRPPFVYAKVDTRSTTEFLEDAPRLERGVLAQTVDALRRPLWSDAFSERVGDGLPWRELPPGETLRPTRVVPSPVTRGVLRQIAATAIQLDQAGIPLRADGIDLNREPGRCAVSIETVARSVSLPHKECLLSAPSHELGDEVGEDRHGRLWFVVDKEPYEQPLKAAVSALVKVEEIQSPRDRSTRPPKPSLTGTGSDVLRGLADLRTWDDARLDPIWRIHAERGEWDDALKVILRMARVPGGRGRGRGRYATRPRTALLNSATVLLPAGGSSNLFRQRDAWLFLAAAAARLGTFGSLERPIVLDASASFLRTRWATRVRALASRYDFPAWFGHLARTAASLEDESVYSEEPTDRVVDSLSAYATSAALESKDAATAGRRPLARFGVWLTPPGSDGLPRP